VFTSASRCDVIERRAQFNLDKSKKRLHLIEGLLLAMQNLDKVVATIRHAKDTNAAVADLQNQFGFSKEQADGVLALTLRRLTSLEKNKIEDERQSLVER
jgi:DNA gyrase subunit A